MGAVAAPFGIALLAAAFAWLAHRSSSFRERFRREAATHLAQPDRAPVVTEADLAPLPILVQQYLRAAGVVGRPRVSNYRLSFRGRIRAGPAARWMPFVAEQQSFTDPPARLFLMRATMWGLPVEAFHRLIDGHATMQVTVAGAIPIVNAKGSVMDRSETVTLFNDMCLLAPGTLLGSGISWEPVDHRSVRARFTNAGDTIAAMLSFDANGLLASFESDDRSRASADGKTFTRLRFMTPVRDYRDFGGVRLAAFGEARWLLPEGAFTYAEFHLERVAYNVRS